MSQNASSHSPLSFFLTAIHGCATQSRFLMEAFAADGDLVLAPIHRDATCKGGKGSWFSRAEIPFRDPGKWNESTYRDRADDIRRLASAIGTDHRFRSRADLSPFALAAGDFLGGYTVLGLAARGQAGNSLRSRQSGPGLLHRARTANSSNDWGWSS